MTQTSNIKHYAVCVSGHVQGVFYRASAAEKARELNLAGFVRNEKDGSVYIEAEGQEHELLAFIEWARRGPARARVASCKVSEGVVKHFSQFEIQR
jgi:acylphosphatase